MTEKLNTYNPFSNLKRIIFRVGGIFLLLASVFVLAQIVLAKNGNGGFQVKDIYIEVQETDYPQYISLVKKENGKEEVAGQVKIVDQYLISDLPENEFLDEYSYLKQGFQDLTLSLESDEPLFYKENFYYPPSLFEKAKAFFGFETLPEYRVIKEINKSASVRTELDLKKLKVETYYQQSTIPEGEQVPYGAGSNQQLAIKQTLTLTNSDDQDLNLSLLLKSKVNAEKIYWDGEYHPLSESPQKFVNPNQIAFYGQNENYLSFFDFSDIPSEFSPELWVQKENSLALLILSLNVSISANSSKTIDPKYSSLKAKEEIVEKRTRNSKTSTKILPTLEERYVWDGTIGAIHYKDNYDNPAEQWKDIDTNIQEIDGKLVVNKAPYNLEVNSDFPGFYYQSKQDKSDFKIELKKVRKVTQNVSVPVFANSVRPEIKGNQVIWKNIYSDVDVIIEAQNTRVVFKRILKSEKAPNEAEFAIKKSENFDEKKLTFRASPDIPLEVEITEDKLVERVDLEGKVFPIEVDPTIDVQVGASGDDGMIRGTTKGASDTSFSTSDAYYQIGATAGSYYSHFLRFVNISGLSGATINSAYIEVYKMYDTERNIETDIWAVDAEAPDAPTDATEYDAAAANKTTETATWDESGIATAGWKSSGDFANVIQELATSYDPSVILIIWESDIPASQYGGMYCHSYERTGNVSGAKLTIEYTLAMKQVIIGSEYDALNTGSAEYNSLLGVYPWGSNEAKYEKLVSTGGELKNLRVRLDDSPGAGKSYTFTLKLNGEATILTLIIADTAISASDTTHAVTVAAGDRVSLECTPSGTPTSRYATWTIIFEGDTPNESLLLGGTSNTVNSSVTEYVSAVAGRPTWSSTERDSYQLVATSGKIKNLYVKLSVDPGDSPEAYRFTLRVNGADSDDGEGNPLQVTITADDTTGNDTTQEITIAAGDYIGLKCEPLNNPTATPYAIWGMLFVADTNGESLILGGSVNNIDAAVTEYNYLSAGSDSSWTATESERYSLGQQTTLKNLYIKLQDAPGSGDSFTFTIRQNEADSDIVVTISEGNTTGNDTVHTLAVSDDDYLDLQCTPSGTPSVGDAWWGLVGTFNTAPTFTDVTDCGTVDPGVNCLITATASDPDSDTIDFYVCKAAGFDGAQCTGGSGEWCHVTGQGPNPSCNATAPTPSEGAQNYYPYIVDEHGLQATGGKQGSAESFTVNNVAPVVSNVKLNNSDPIDLSSGGEGPDGNINIDVTADVNDNNGCTDVTTVTAKAYYRDADGDPGAAQCTVQDNNNCYFNISCTGGGCNGGVNEPYTCTANFKYHANPTGAATPWTDYDWRTTVTAQDEAQSHSLESSGVELSDFLALTVSVGGDTTIDYGNLAVGDISDGTTLPQQSTVKASGNCGLDVKLGAEKGMCTDYPTCTPKDATHTPIAQSQQKYGTSATTWTDGAALSSSVPGNEYDLNCKKTTVTATPEDEDVYWGLQIPDETLTGSYTGSTTFTALKTETGEW